MRVSLRSAERAKRHGGRVQLQDGRNHLHGQRPDLRSDRSAFITGGRLIYQQIHLGHLRSRLDIQAGDCGGVYRESRRCLLVGSHLYRLAQLRRRVQSYRCLGSWNGKSGKGAAGILQCVFRAAFREAGSRTYERIYKKGRPDDILRHRRDKDGKGVV